MDWRKMRNMVIVFLLVIPTVFLFLGVGEWCTPSANAADVKTMRVQAAAPNTSLSYVGRTP
jgi:hypothetical protein